MDATRECILFSVPDCTGRLMPGGSAPIYIYSYVLGSDHTRSVIASDTSAFVLMHPPFVDADNPRRVVRMAANMRFILFLSIFCFLHRPEGYLLFILGHARL